jgi:MSHA biogenesis protein MshP
MITKNKGFALVGAVFILVVLGLLSVFIIRINGVGRSTSMLTVQGVRAYYAAFSGLEWGNYQAVVLSSCPTSTTLTMTQGALVGFTAVVQCSSQVTTEGTLYRIVSISQKGTFGTMDYVSRTLTSIVVQ